MVKANIKQITPEIGLPGGIVNISGKGFTPWEIKNEDIDFCGKEPWIDGVSETNIITTIPVKIETGNISIKLNGGVSNKIGFYVPDTIAVGLHLVDNPVCDHDGNIYATYSGSRGESTHVSLYKISPFGEKTVYLKGLTNATSLAIDKKGDLFISSRFNGKVYKSSEEQEYTLYSQGLGVAFGLAFNSANDLYAGDRSGSIFKISENGIAEFFASIPQSYISFHLAFDSKDRLYVSNPTHIGENFIFRVLPDGKVEQFHSGYSMFHGFCFDSKDNMYITEVKRNESRIIKLDIETGEWEVLITGSNFIGANFDNNDNLLISSSNAIYRVNKDIIKN